MVSFFISIQATYRFKIKADYAYLYKALKMFRSIKKPILA